MKKIARIGFVFVSLMVVAIPAFAAVDLTGVVLDTASVLSLATIILVALGAIWGVRKLIKLANRS